MAEPPSFAARRGRGQKWSSSCRGQEPDVSESKGAGPDAGDGVGDGPDDRIGDGPRPKVRVFLVDDHHLFLTGVRAELGDAVEVVGDADEVGAAIELIAERVPDVVLVDVHMPDGGGQAVIEAIGRTHPEVRFLALSVSDAAEDVIGVIRAGARGYVTKTISGPELTDAVERVADGDAVFSPRLAGFVLDAFAADPGAAGGAVPSFDPELDQLTPPG